MKEELDIENAMSLYETLDVSEGAKDLYFDKVILQEGLNVKGGMEKLLKIFQKKFDATKTLADMTGALNKMKELTKDSPVNSAVMDEYLKSITEISTRITAAQAKLDEVSKKAETTKTDTTAPAPDTDDKAAEKTDAEPKEPVDDKELKAEKPEDKEEKEPVEQEA